MGESGERPFVTSKSVGQIENPVVAHEVYNTIEEQRLRAHVPDEEKKLFFLHHGDNAPLIAQAEKTIQLEEDSLIEPLTGLHTKVSFKHFVDRGLDRLENGSLEAMGVIRFDLDYFSWINDILEAHQMGDLYLAMAGKILRTQARASKDIGFRVGGDEFAVLIQNSLNPDQFAHVVERIHSSLSGNVLPEVINALRHTSRFIKRADGKTEREDTIAFKQFLRGLINLRENADGRRDHFLLHGRGAMKRKEVFLEHLDKIDSTAYEEYLKDTRTYSELSESEKQTREAVEGRIGEMVIAQFPQLTMSTGGIYLDKQSTATFDQIDRKVDGLVSEVKRQGGGKYTVESGFSGKKIG